MLVRDTVRATMWTFGLMLEWRWTDEALGLWEGRVNTGEDEAAWVAGDRLKRIGGRVPEPSTVP
ncbi:MAG: hypothetical protein PSX37_10545 [bacterium]|nr:hypothetical protein [bacterium]